MKKIIAREVLVLFVAIGLSLLCYAAAALNNYRIEKKIDYNKKRREFIIEHPVVSKKDPIGLDGELKKLVPIDQELSELNKSKLDEGEQRTFVLQSFVVFLIAFFGIRYVYYIIRWCVATLRN